MLAFMPSLMKKRWSPLLFKCSTKVSGPDGIVCSLFRAFCCIGSLINSLRAGVLMLRKLNHTNVALILQLSTCTWLDLFPCQYVRNIINYLYIYIWITVRINFKMNQHKVITLIYGKQPKLNLSFLSSSHPYKLDAMVLCKKKKKEGFMKVKLTIKPGVIERARHLSIIR